MDHAEKYIQRKIYILLYIFAYPSWLTSVWIFQNVCFSFLVFLQPTYKIPDMTSMHGTQMFTSGENLEHRLQNKIKN